MSSQNQNAIPPANPPANAATQPVPPSGGWPIYPSLHSVNKARYITSNDPRGYLPVYEYVLRDQPMMMDMDDGFILWTSICKALGKSKADITRMIESDAELQLANKLRRVKGGFLRVQGTWIPQPNAKALARKIAWEIKDDLVPFFGPDFPATCLAPNDPGFADILAPRQRARRGTNATASGTHPSPSGNSPSQTQGQAWLPSPPPTAHRHNTAPTPMMSTYSAGFASPPRGNHSPSSQGSSHTQTPHGYSAGTQPAPQARFRSASGTSSPGQTITEEPYGLEGNYSDPSRQYPPNPGYAPYSTNNNGYHASSAPMYSSPPAQYAYFQPQYQQPPYQPGYQAHPAPQQSQPGYPAHPAPQQSQPGYPANPTPQQSHLYGSPTPIQTSYPSHEYAYASHGVSDGPPQPCNTYQQHQDANRTSGYPNPGYQTAQQSYPGQYQHQHQYPSYTNESNVRHTSETTSSSDTTRTAYENGGGPSSANYGYTNASGSPVVQGQSAQQAYQQQGQPAQQPYQQQPIQHSDTEDRPQTPIEPLPWYNY